MNDSLPWFLGPAGLDALKRKENYVVLDYETSILPGFATNPDQHLVLACWTVVKDGVTTEKWRFSDEYDQQELEKDIKAADFVVAHNAKFECQWLQRSGIDLHDVLVYCTMAAEWVILGNNPKRKGLSLDDVGMRRLGEAKDGLGSKLIKNWSVCPSITPRSWLLHYCKQDVSLTHRIFLQQVADLEQLGVWHIAFSRFLTIPVLADIELQGLELDAEKVYAEYKNQLEIKEKAAEELDEVTGGINLASGPQVRKLLYEKLGFAIPKDPAGREILTDTGLPSTSEDAISRLVAYTVEQKLFVEKYKVWNKAATLLSKSLTFLRNVCLHNDSKFFGTLNQGRTQTHRLASNGMGIKFPGTKTESKIQLQNIPRQYKKMFVAHDPDYLVMENDGAQLEFRVGGALGHDTEIAASLENGVDVHALTRDTMMEHKHPDFDGLDLKEARQEAKAKTFQPMYGGRGGHAAEQAYSKAWALKYKELVATQEEWCLRVAADRKFRTPYGMWFYWPHARLNQWGKVNVRTEVYNFAIQGLATGEIIPIALVYFWHRTRHLRCYIFNTVHDSIISRVHKEDVDEANAAAKVSLTTDVYNFLREIYDYEFTLPLGVGTKIGKYWGDGVEQVWEVWPDGRDRYTEKD